MSPDIRYPKSSFTNPGNVLLFSEVPKTPSVKPFLGVVLVIGHGHTAFDLWNAEVSSEMNQVQRTDRAGNDDEVDRVVFGEQDGDIADCIVFEANPKPGASQSAALLVIIYQLFPALGLIFLFHGAQRRGVVHAGSGEMKTVNGNSAHASNHPAKVVVV